MLKIPDRIDSKFRYVLLSAMRAEQLVEGALPKIDADRTKFARTAMRELAEGAVNWDYGPAPEPEPDENEEAEETEA